MADFFAFWQKKNRRLHFLWLTPAKHDRLRSLMASRGIGERDYTVLAAMPAEVPSYLSAADAGLAFIKPCLSKLASSPTKYAEYLGCGLPLIINAGIGDSDALITEERAGALVRDFNESEYARAVSLIEDCAGHSEQTRRRTRAVAERLFDVRRVGVERYARLYETVLNGRS
jgi:glycosyltransferase involved in cell wall biosynthesis